MKRFLSRFSNKTKLVAVAAVLAFTAGVLAPVATKAGFGPTRETKVYKDGVAGFDHVTFNSFTNVPNVGDERAFFTGKYPSGAAYTDPLAQVKDGDVVTLQVYVHNGADDSLNSVPDGKGGYKGIAKDTTVRVALPSTIAKSQQATAYVSASNATPGSVYDTLDFGAENGGMFQIEYVPGSAHIKGNYINTALPDSIVTTGTKIGTDSLNGEVKGCFKEMVYVTLQVKVKMPQYQITKQVRMKSATTQPWGETVNAKGGDTVQWSIGFNNNGKTPLSSVSVIDQVPAGLTVVPGSVRLINGNYPSGYTYAANAVQDNGRTINVNIGDYNPGINAYVRFDTTVDNPAPTVCKEQTLVNKAFATPKGFGAIWDTANVVVAGNTCVPTQSKPVYSCDMFRVVTTKEDSTVADHTVKVSEFKTTAKDGAVFKQAVITWGDSSDKLVTNNVLGQTHKYATDGTYHLRADAVFTVTENGTTKDVTVSGENCQQDVTFSTTTPPVTPPTTPPILPDTGAAGVAGLFAFTSVAGAAAHRIVSRRRED